MILRRGTIARMTLFACALTMTQGAARAADHYLILVGSGGEAAYEKTFSERGDRLKAALVARAQASESNIALLSARTGDRPLTLESVQAAIEGLSRHIGGGDNLCIVLIGHGSQIKGEPKFQIPGPDLEAKALGGMLDALKPRMLAIINTTSSSAGFINFLSAPGRIICTATKSAGERNVTFLADHLVGALEEGSADQNRDERISLLEWLQQADALTQAQFTGEGLIASEHALLDDNGDALGTRLSEVARQSGGKPDAAAGPADGAAADAFFIRDFEFPPSAPKPLIEKYLGLLKKVEALKSRKGSTPAPEYAKELERILTEAAKAHREIRGFGTKPS